MNNPDRIRVDQAAAQLAGDAAEMLDALCEIPANGVTGEGYPETVAFISSAFEESGLTVKHVPVPRQELDDLWGADLKKSHEFLQVTNHAPRTIVMASDDPAKEAAVHLSNHYDLWGSVRDTRAGTVAQIMAARALRNSGVSLVGGLVVSATPDGHLGGRTGAGYLVKQGLGRTPVVILGSTSGADTVTLGFKGEVWLRVTVNGKSAHPSRPQDGVNSIEAMTHIQLALMQLAQKYENQRSDFPILPPESNRPTIAMCRVSANLDSTAIPASCDLYVDRRLNPDESAADAVDEIKRTVTEAVAGWPVTTQVDVIEEQDSATTSPDRPVVEIFRHNIEEVVGKRHREAVWSHFFDFRFFSTEWGADTIAYSPGADRTRSPGGSQGSAVSRDELTQGIRVLALGLYDLLSAERD